MELSLRKKIVFIFSGYMLISIIIPGLIGAFVSTGDTNMDFLIIAVSNIALLIVFAIGLGFVLSGWILRPIDMLSELAINTAGGNLEEEVPDMGQDELGQIAGGLGRLRNSLLVARDIMGALPPPKPVKRRTDGLKKRIIGSMIIMTVVGVATPMAALNINIPNFALVLLTVTAIIISACIMMVYNIRVIAMPLKQLANDVESISRGELDNKIKVTEAGEIGTLQASFEVLRKRTKKVMSSLGM